MPVAFTVEEISLHITYTTEDWFSDRQTKPSYKCNPTRGDGSNFLYSIDGGIPQISNTFRSYII
jgi:hypothetical protein